MPTKEFQNPPNQRVISKAIASWVCQISTVVALCADSVAAQLAIKSGIVLLDLNVAFVTTRFKKAAILRKILIGKGELQPMPRRA